MAPNNSQATSVKATSRPPSPASWSPKPKPLVHCATRTAARLSVRGKNSRPGRNLLGQEWWGWGRMLAEPEDLRAVLEPAGEGSEAPPAVRTPAEVGEPEARTAWREPAPDQASYSGPGCQVSKLTTPSWGLFQSSQNDIPLRCPRRHPKLPVGVPPGSGGGGAMARSIAP